MARKRTPLTARQVEVLQKYTGYFASNGFPPTLRELMELLSISSINGMRTHLVALERKGYLERAMDNSARAIRPVHPLVKTKIATGILRSAVSDLPSLRDSIEHLESKFKAGFNGTS